MNKKTSEPLTKDFFVKSLSRLTERIRDEVKFAIETSEEKMVRNIQEGNDKILTKLDSIVKDIEELKEDEDIGVDQIRELRIEVDDHEKRIKKLERSNV